MAQTTTASVQGTVRDPQGNAAASAQAVLASSTTGSTQTVTADARGTYTFPVVTPGSYTLTITAAGFKPVKYEKIIVAANDRFNAGVTTLEVGKQEETVTVVGRPPELQVSDGARAYTVESSVMKNIAQNGRSIIGLVQLVPGVKMGITQGGPNNGTIDFMSGFSANGARTNSNNLTLDGIANIDTGDNGTAMVTTNLDSVAEFKVLTSSYQAEYGRAVGAQLQVVTKSGGQQFSGSAYWYARRNKWNANGFMNNARNTARDEIAKRDEYGANLGGPIYIPGKFNADKKKLFFFAGVEMQRRKDPPAASTVRVPTQAERNGDFSNSVFNGVNQSVTIAPGQIYAPGLAILSLYPLPNVEGQTAYNYSSQVVPDQPRDEMIARLDYHPSDNWRVMGRYMRNTDPNWQPLGIGWAAGGNIPMKGYRHLPGYNWMGSINGMINSTTSLELQVGSAHNYQEIGSDEPLLKRTTTLPGITDIPLLYPAAQQGFIPRFNFNLQGGNAAAYFTQQAPFVNWNTTIDAVANLTKIAGAHVFKAGLYFQQSKKPQSPFSPFNGQITFATGGGQLYDTGNPYANAAVGYYNAYTQASRYAYPMYKYSNFEGYIQDNWKATRRLTLDYGVRFYSMTPQDDAETKAISNFFPAQWSASAAPRLFVPACADGSAGPCEGNRIGVDPAGVAAPVAESLIGRIVPGSGDPFNGSGKATDTKMFAGAAKRISPRIGFTYDLTGRQTTILRGAFGIFYDRPQGNTRFNMVGNPPGVSTPNLGNDKFENLVAAMANAANVPLAPTGSNPSEYEFTLPTVYSWNVGAQMKLPKSFVWDVAYVGNKSTKLLGLVQMNSVPYGGYYQTANQDTTRNPGVLGTTALPTNVLRPYRGYDTINMWSSLGVGNYHALQTGLQRRFDNGLMVGVSYTFSKTLGTGSSDYAPMRVDGKDRQYNYGLLQSDQPHSFVANLIYQTPKVAQGPAGYILNGWQISGIFRYASGFPYQVNYGFADNTGNNVITGSDQAARIVVKSDPGKGWSSDPMKQFDYNVFGPPQPGSIGTESSQYILHQAPLQNLDLSLSKSFQLVGRSKFEIRLDAFNALNKTNVFSTNNTVRFNSLADPTITNTNVTNANGTPNMGVTGGVSGIWPARQLQVMGRFTF